MRGLDQFNHRGTLITVPDDIEGVMRGVLGKKNPRSGDFRIGIDLKSPPLLCRETIVTGRRLEHDLNDQLDRFTDRNVRKIKQDLPRIAGVLIARRRLLAAAQHRLEFGVLAADGEFRGIPQRL